MNLKIKQSYLLSMKAFYN